MHSLRKLKAIEGIHNKGHAALAGLAVNPHNRLILPPDIGRVDRQIGNLPVLALSLLKRLHPLINRILVRPGKCRKYQLSCIRMTRVNFHLCASFVDIHQFLNIFQI